MTSAWSLWELAVRLAGLWGISMLGRCGRLNDLEGAVVWAAEFVVRQTVKIARLAEHSRFRGVYAVLSVCCHRQDDSGFLPGS